MLVIRRREGESILIGENIEIQVTEIGATRVKLAVSAPKEIRVLRKEVELTRLQNVAAAGDICSAQLENLIGNLRSRPGAGVNFTSSQRDPLR